MRPEKTNLMSEKPSNHKVSKNIRHSDLETHQQHPRGFRLFETSNFNPFSIKWKILVIALVTAIAFAAYLGFNLIQSNFQASLLKDIRDKHYPTHIKLQEASFTLKFIQSRMQDAVITGELDTLAETEQLKMQFLTAINEIEHIDSGLRQNSNQIGSTFMTYYENSYRLARDLLGGSVDPTVGANRGSENALLYQQVVDQIDQFKDNELGNLNRAVSRVTERANSVVSIGFPVGLTTMLIVFILAIFASGHIINRVNHIVNTLRNIAQKNADMSVRIPIEGHDEMSELAFWFNQFIKRLEQDSKESTAEIRHMAYTDALTQLPNRRLFNSHLKSAIRRCHDEKKSLAVMFLDLDNFKAVNDQLGHEAGDKLVREVGNRLAQTVRGDDFVAHDDESIELSGQHLVARMGGDEFMLIITDLRQTEQAEQVAERVCETILEPIDIDGTAIEIGVSIGIAIYPDDGESAETLVVNADLAMYEAKNRGKNNYYLFNKHLEKTARLNLQIESALRQSLNNDLFELHYQPKFDIFSGSIIGAEALLRWQHPKLGAVSPARFIPVAEHSNLIYDIDEWVMNHACKQIHQWTNSGLALLPIAINISARQAARRDLIEKIERFITLYEIPEFGLEVEITETSALSDIKIVAENIRALQRLKVTVALDDFGAGHSSLSLLKYCEIDTLKIDRGFLTELNSPGNKPIYKAVIELAKVLNMQTVAEGIEQNSELENLKKLGCRVAQGFLLASPMPAAKFESYLKKTRTPEALNG